MFVLILQVEINVFPAICQVGFYIFDHPIFTSPFKVYRIFQNMAWVLIIFKWHQTRC